MPGLLLRSISADVLAVEPLKPRGGIVEHFALRIVQAFPGIPIESTDSSDTPQPTVAVVLSEQSCCCQGIWSMQRAVQRCGDRARAY
jgi:hypothetical protein